MFSLATKLRHIPRTAHASLVRSVSKLSEAQKRAAIQELQDGSPFAWEESEGRDAITKVFQFTDFSEAWSFLSRTALLAEKMDHHPEIFNIYSTVEVTLTTHDCDGVSSKDIQMAKAMNSYAKSILPGTTST